MSKSVVVGISDLNAVKAPDQLITYALGSCVGICLYDRTTKIAGLAHIMLPSSKEMGGGTNQPFRYADTGIAALVKMMVAMGAIGGHIQAKIAGGAQMFAATSNTAISNIGQRNVEAVRQTLNQMRIPILADDTGSNYGRTVIFNSEDGMMLVKSAARGEKLL
jgi:chemotaxis protein CheD